MATPDCLCSNEDMLACDWEVVLTQTIKRAGDNGKVANVTTSVSGGMSLVEVLSLGLHQANGASSGVADAAIAEIKACLGADSEQAQAAQAMLDL